MFMTFSNILNSSKKSFFRDCFDFLKRLCKYNASVETDSDQKKMEYSLLRQNHIIEKGLSMNKPHKKFGYDNVKSLCIRLLKYHELYGEKNPLFLHYPISTIHAYIEYMYSQKTVISEIKELYTKLINVSKCTVINDIAGISVIKKDELLNKAFDFEKFVNLRHSIRFFSQENPSQELLNKALEIAQKTPSACNRQCWKVHQFIGQKCTNLLKWQEGARGFEKEPTVAFLITADLKAFLFHEPFQAYIDGGMYAMSLIYALHSVGLGTIPLSCGFQSSKLNEMRKTFNIPENEIPIEIIATGVLSDSFKVAISKRKNINEVLVKHENPIN